MTYRDLIAILKAATPEQLDQDVTVEHSGEYFPALVITPVNDDRLDAGQLVIFTHQTPTTNV